MGKVAQEKHTLLEALLKDNVKPSVIAKTLQYTPSHTSRLIKKSKTFQLVTNKRVRVAAKAIDYLSNIDNYHNDIRIKPSDVIAAGKAILDRSHPIISDNPIPNQSIQINIMMDTLYPTQEDIVINIDNEIKD